MTGGILRPLLTGGGSGPERVADGLWRVQGQPGAVNVYFIESNGGLVQFDAGGRSMLEQLRAAIDTIGSPLREVVLGHAHADHRGCAGLLGVPVACHAAERDDAEGSGGLRYQRLDDLPLAQRLVQRHVVQGRLFEGGPVPIARTLQEGDEVAGFRVVHLPGHAPGLIALVRDLDGVALTSDAFYVIDAWGRPCSERLPVAPWNADSNAAAASLRKLAAVDITVAWPGHGEALTADVGRRLLDAASGGGRSARWPRP